MFECGTVLRLSASWMLVGQTGDRGTVLDVNWVVNWVRSIVVATEPRVTEKESRPARASSYIFIRFYLVHGLDVNVRHVTVVMVECVVKHESSSLAGIRTLKRESELRRHPHMFLWKPGPWG